MGYLAEFEEAIESHDAPSILRLWEEYTSTDEVEEEDFLAILKAVKASELHEYIGRHVERGLSLWHLMEPGPRKDEVLRLIVDLEMTNGEELRSIVFEHLRENFGSEKQFNEKLRLIGLRGGESYKGAISHYLLLNHMKRGNFVFHTAGWGVGEIMDVSMLREQLSLEFDYVPGRKEMAFHIAFTTLIPLPDSHFLARRFGDPDALEEEARKNPIQVIRMLLKDLGPKTAAEIKDELCELVIPEGEWNKWWQTARTKLKKDVRIENPSSSKKPFRLLKQEISHEERLQKALEKKPDADTLINMVYTFVKDFGDTLKNREFTDALQAKLKELTSFAETTLAQELQIHFFLQDLSHEKQYEPIKQLIKEAESIKTLIKEISIPSFKKRTLINVRATREDWEVLFLELLFCVEQNPARDYILGQLLDSSSQEKLKQKLIDLSVAPQQHPELTIWYFQKLLGSEDLPLADSEGRAAFFEALLILLSYLEKQEGKRDLVKKIHNMLSASRFALVRNIMQQASVEQVQEFLLLTTKCHSLADHDIQIFHSLAEVAHPELKGQTKAADAEEEVIWTTKEGYAILQKKIEQIATVETVDNAKEIEVARSHGDLRENAEFKAALERRDRLQAELKFLSDQLNKCRILTAQDIDTSQVSVGTKVLFKGENGSHTSYSLLGPWDANPEAHILSFQSKLAKEILGLKKGDAAQLQGKTLTIAEITSAI